MGCGTGETGGTVTLSAGGTAGSGAGCAAESPEMSYYAPEAHPQTGPAGRQPHRAGVWPLRL
eukprot:214377-Lingulodinium_polyedra.AAC.1